MKWKTARTKHILRLHHSFYRLDIYKVQPKGHFAVELFKEDILVFQSIERGFKKMYSRLLKNKQLIKRGI
jgi:hypothetical protein